MLTEKGATKLTSGELERLANFLNIEKKLPIVAHNASYDRNDVLIPALIK